MSPTITIERPARPYFLRHRLRELANTVSRRRSMTCRWYAHDELTARSRAVAVRLDGAAVQSHDALDEIQADAEASARRFHGMLALHKQIEHIRESVGRNPDAFVPNADDCLIGVALDAHHDPSVALAVLGGI